VYMSAVLWQRKSLKSFAPGAYSILYFIKYIVHFFTKEI
jgi:hypothetical protein